MDIYKCPKMKTQKNFPQKISFILYNNLKFLLKAKLPLVKDGKYNKLKFLLKENCMSNPGTYCTSNS